MPEVVRPWSQSGAFRTDAELLAASVHIPDATCQPTFELQQLPDPRRAARAEFDAQIRRVPETWLAAASRDLDELLIIAAGRSHQRRGQEPAAEGGGSLPLVPSRPPAPLVLDPSAGGGAVAQEGDAQRQRRLARLTDRKAKAEEEGNEAEARRLQGKIEGHHRFKVWAAGVRGFRQVRTPVPRSPPLPIQVP
jgi:hypothetical protein